MVEVLFNGLICISPKKDRYGLFVVALSLHRTKNNWGLISYE